MLGMRLRHAAPSPVPKSVSSAEEVEKLEAEVSGWRTELSALGAERAALQAQSDADPTEVKKALAALDLRKQRLIWGIRESEQLLRAHRRRPLTASLQFEPPPAHATVAAPTEQQPPQTCNQLSAAAHAPLATDATAPDMPTGTEGASEQGTAPFASPPRPPLMTRYSSSSYSPPQARHRSRPFPSRRHALSAW